MNIEEKRILVDDCCDKHKCSECPLRGKVWEHPNNDCLFICEASEEELDRALELFHRKANSEAVNHPSHYNQGKFECIDVMLETFGREATKNFCLLNAFKYVWRTGEKNGKEDIEKAIWYLNKYLELGKGEDHESNADGASA